MLTATVSATMVVSNNMANAAQDPLLLLASNEKRYCINLSFWLLVAYATPLSPEAHFFPQHFCYRPPQRGKAFPSTKPFMRKETADITATSALRIALVAMLPFNSLFGGETGK
jgi:hypothetical protein